MQIQEELQKHFDDYAANYACKLREPEVKSHVKSFVDRHPELASVINSFVETMAKSNKIDISNYQRISYQIVGSLAEAYFNHARKGSNEEGDQH